MVFVFSGVIVNPGEDVINMEYMELLLPILIITGLAGLKQNVLGPE